jgi:hypothetical protein
VREGTKDDLDKLADALAASIRSDLGFK